MEKNLEKSHFGGNVPRLLKHRERKIDQSQPHRRVSSILGGTEGLYDSSTTSTLHRRLHHAEDHDFDQRTIQKLLALKLLLPHSRYS